MTYPPQQPGPYGQQPDPYGQQGQPGWSGGFDQTQQYPGQYPGQQYPGQQPGYGYPGGQPPKKSNTGLIVTLVIVGVLLVGGGVTTFLLLNKDDSTGTGGPTTTAAPANATAQEVVDKVIAAVDAKDSAAAIATLCDPNSPSKKKAFELDKVPANVTLKTRLVGKVSERGEQGMALLSIDARETGSSRSNPLSMTLDLKSQEGKWCVNNALLREARTSTTSRPSSTRPSF